MRPLIQLSLQVAVSLLATSENLSSIRNEPEFLATVEDLGVDLARQLEGIRVLPDLGRFDLRNKELEQSL